MAFHTLARHVGIIMDGNGRWAAGRALPRAAGHAAGMKAMEALVGHAREIGIEYLTLYALSTENMSRPEEELEELFSLIETYLEKEREKLERDGTRVKFIGDLSPLPERVRCLCEDVQRECREGSFTLVFAVNYGGRAEIVRAAAAAAASGKEIDEKTFSSFLYTEGLPDPDLVVRTGGERRLSNFLLYESAYSELYFSKTLFPDFTPRKLDKALKDFSKRDRRYGKVGET